jgi:Uma2 family endonuclease
MTPTGGKTGNRNIKIYLAIGNWNTQNQYGEMFDSSTGFRLPDGSTLAPDASIVSQARWDSLSNEEQEKFPPLCPDFIVELKSKSDHLPTLQQKMENWIANGARLAWLIDPDQEQVHIYRPQQTPELVTGFDNTLSGENVLQGLVFDLSILR